MGTKAEKKAVRRKPVWASTEGLSLFPPLRGDAKADVCVIGGGMAGMNCAYRLAREGKSVVLLDAGSPGGGETYRTTAHLSNAVDGGYREIERLHGTETARLVAQSHTDAIRRIESTSVEEGIDCDFERVDGYLFRPSGLPSRVLSQEYRAALRAGVPDVGLVRRTPLEGVDAGPALRFGAQAQFHPLKYLTGLAALASRLGVRIHGRTRVERVKGGDAATVITASGARVSCGAVVVTTHTPFNDWVVIHTKQAPYRTYAIAARVPRRSVARALYWDAPENDRAYHYARVQPYGRHHDLLVVGGEDHKVGQADDGERRFERLEAWTRAHFPKAFAKARTAEWRWSGQVLEPVDDLAFIGRNPMDEGNVYVATGFSGMGMTYGTIAGLLLADLIEGRANAWEKVYDPGRVTSGALLNFARENSNVLLQYRDWFTAGKTPCVDGVPAGQGAVLRDGLSKIAVYRDGANVLHAVTAVCPHLGGIVAWNSTEKSWDCPCHGSRFDPYGKVLHGPASCDLAPATLPQTSTHEPKKKESTMKKKTTSLSALVAVLGTASIALGGLCPSAYAGDKAPEQYPADNTGRNVRDAQGTTMTPEDQSGSEGDRKLTQKVRQAIMDDKALSVNAQNVKIITVGGKVTLRGPVKSPGEKLNVVSKARQIAGLENVTDELEIAP